MKVLRSVGADQAKYCLENAMIGIVPKRLPVSEEC
jgi:hypothetical protein